jgi:hypothetical protein
LRVVRTILGVAWEVGGGNERPDTMRWADAAARTATRAERTAAVGKADDIERVTGYTAVTGGGDAAAPGRLLKHRHTPQDNHRVDQCTDRPHTPNGTLSPGRTMCDRATRTLCAALTTAGLLCLPRTAQGTGNAEPESDTHKIDGPIVLYAPTASFDRETHAEGDALPDSVLGAPLPPRTLVRTGGSRAHLLLCPGQILELSRNSTVTVGALGKNLIIREGNVTLHAESSRDTLCYPLDADSATIRYASPGTLLVAINNAHVQLAEGRSVSYGAHHRPAEGWHARSSRDGSYLFALLHDGVLPATSFEFDFPSTRRRRFRHSARGYAGIATFEGQQYYVGEVLYRIRHPRLDFDFVYNVWLAFSDRGALYREAWNEWTDILDHIHYIRLFRRDDPVNVRIGLIERLTYGRGLLVHNYNNAVFLPFEKHNGLELTFRHDTVRGSMFVNDIARPCIIGSMVSWARNENTRFRVSYAGDIDQYSNVSDTDRDSYPDRIDPEPRVFNTPEDSVIKATSPQRLDEVESRQLHGLAVGIDHRYMQTKDLRVDFVGELGVHTGVGAGISFPNVLVGYRRTRLGVGFEFQTPRFAAGIFDRDYEFSKVRFIQKEDGSYRMLSRGRELEETDGWLYGWNCSFGIRLPHNADFGVRFRDVWRGETRDKSLILSLDSGYHLVEQVTRWSLFIEQKNVSKLFRERTHGQNWGVQLRIVPHHTIQVRLRYRERYSDDDGDGSITSGEAKRNMTASATVDGDYWWREFQKWRARRRRAKGEEQSARGQR